MDRKYIKDVKPLTDHVLQVDFVSGSRLLLDMKPYLDKFRFRSLSDPQSNVHIIHHIYRMFYILHNIHSSWNNLPLKSLHFLPPSLLYFKELLYLFLYDIDFLS